MAAKKRDTSKKRNEILEAAIEAFKEKGFEHASMDYIAEKSCSSKRTVYNHFNSKDELFHAMIAKFVSELIEIKEINYSPEQSLKEQLEKFADVKIAISSNPKWLGIMKISIGVFVAHPKLAKETMEKVSALESPLINWIEAAKADGKLAVDSAELAASVFSSLLSGSFFWPSVIHGQLPEAEVSVMKNEIIEVFLAKYLAKE